MNTSFHTTSIDRAYTSLALTSSGSTLHVRIGSQRLEIGMVSCDALQAALRQLRRSMTVTLSEAIAVCGDWNGESTLEGRATSGSP
jgi:hypothetical protein